MSTRMARTMIMMLSILAVAAAYHPPAFASSDLRTGQSGAQGPGAGKATDAAVCRLFIGPRGPVEEGQFLLRIGDIDPSDGEGVLELRGTAVSDGQGSITLSADQAAAQDFYEQVLRTQFNRSTSEFDLQRLLVEVTKTEADIGDASITCKVRLSGSLIEGGQLGRRVTFSYDGSGLFIAGIEEPAAGGADGQVASAASLTASATAEPTQGQCTAPNFAPRPEFCDQTSNQSCLVSFAGYQWWTEFDFFSPPASPPTGANSGFWNNNNLWSPRNVTVDAEGLHLFVQEQDTLDNQGNCCVRRWTAAEAVTALNPNGSLAHLGYGTYLVAAKVKTAPSWDAMDPNVAFGVFTYERVGTGDTNNPFRELDLAEVSRWGRQDGVPCSIQPPKLCEGNAQFTLQLWDAGGPSLPNLFRYTIGGGTNEITLVMIWTGAQQPVTFRQYNGLFTLATLPATPNNQWITPAAQNPWVPADGCQQFHLNLWMGNFTNAASGFNPPPTSPQEVVVTNFQYQPSQ
jgi:hypothetical protein